MVFADDGAPGQGVLVPCKTPLASAAELLAEAKLLWQAEQKSKVPTDTISASWGCVGILFRAQPAPDKWIRTWSKYFLDSVKAPIAPVGKDGVICMPWPVNARNGQEADVDVILATATKAETIRPSPKEIAEAWSAQDKGYECYFFQNVRNRIRTFEDGAIWKCIEEGSAPWLNKFQSDYAEAVAKLHSENTSED